MIEYYGKAAGQLTGIPTPYLIQTERAIRKGKPKELIFSPYSLGETGKKKKKTETDWDKIFNKRPPLKVNTPTIKMGIPTLKIGDILK